MRGPMVQTSTEEEDAPVRLYNRAISWLPGRVRREESMQRGEQVLGNFLGHMMAAVERVAAEVIGPWTPDAEDIAIKILHFCHDYVLYSTQ